MHGSPLSRETVLAFMRALDLEIVPESVTSVGHGEWSQAFYVSTADGRDLVVRFSATDDDFLKDERAEAYASARLPIPHVLQVGRAIDDRFYAISTRAAGEFLEERNADAMTGLLPSIFATLDGMREADVSATRGFGLWRGSDGDASHASWREVLLGIADDPPSARTHGWRALLPNFPDANRAFDQAYARLQTLVDACPEQRHLVHSDLLNFNALVVDERVSAVIDWGSALYGDWLWDLAWLTFWQPWYTRWSQVDIRGAALSHYRQHAIPVPNFAERLRCYELAIGLDGLAYQTWVNRQDGSLAWTTRRVQEVVSAPI